MALAFGFAALAALEKDPAGARLTGFLVVKPTKVCARSCFGGTKAKRAVHTMDTKGLFCNQLLLGNIIFFGILGPMEIKYPWHKAWVARLSGTRFLKRSVFRINLSHGHVAHACRTGLHLARFAENARCGLSGITSFARLVLNQGTRPKSAFVASS